MMEQRKPHGPVRTLRTELAEWDITKEQWQPPRSSSMLQLRPDGTVEQRKDHYPNGSSAQYGFSYDEAGHLLESTFQSDDGQIGKTVYRYDDSGRLVRKSSVDANGIEQAPETYSYDHGGRKTKVQSVPKFDNPGSCGTMYGVEGAEQAYSAEGVATITTLYDDREQSTEALFRNDSGDLILRVLLTRDGAGRLLSEESRIGNVAPFPVDQALESARPEERAEAAALLAQLFSPDKTFSLTTYDYDDRGRQTFRRGSLAGADQSRTTWEYDEHDNPIREISEDTSGELQPDESGNLHAVNEKSSRHEVRYEYEYDSHGNWTERVVSVRYEINPDFQRSNIERRQISYYSRLT